MGELYPFCSKCDAELTDVEKTENEKHDNIFYPICNSCLEKHEKKLKEIIDIKE